VDPNRPYTLLDDRLWFVDTGASRTTCDDDLVAALGVRVRRTAVRSHGEVGSVPLGRAVLHDVTIGGWTFRRLPCAVRDLPTTSSLKDDPGDPVVGILGANVLRHFAAEFAFAEGELRLRREAEGDGSEGSGVDASIRLRRERGVGPRLVAPLVVDGARVDVVIDTGADRTYLPLTTGEELLRYAGRRHGTGPGGGTPIEVVIRGVTEATLGREPVALYRYVFRRGRPGLLGMDVLAMRRLVVDGPRKRLRWDAGAAPVFRRPAEARKAAQD
jgi:hypothetical protein